MNNKTSNSNNNGNGNKLKVTNGNGPSPTVVTRHIPDITADTKNVYESIAILAKRANQIAARDKEELHSKLAEFATTTDNLEEIFENREQIEISRYYEKQPKPTLVALYELQEGKIYFRKPEEN